ncbi:hypothetical protein JW979_06425 [bacterium]|nr:hypothetical protein [candidate division CSSED10-310 bacterium]
MTVQQIIVLTAAFWVTGSLSFLGIRSMRRQKSDVSTPEGRIWDGIAYAFTYSMLPGHKETVNRHLVKFILGVFLHIGVFWTIAKTAVYIVNPAYARWFPVISGCVVFPGILSASVLLVMRIITRAMRAISCLDDYAASIVTIIFIAAGFLYDLHVVNNTVFAGIVSGLAVYMPLGKLKHAVLFFLARADFGGRLGYRGTYRFPQIH